MSYTVVPCPICGGEMNIRAKRCKKCVSELHGTRPTQMDTCPKCGGKKNIRAKTCKACQYVSRKVTRSPRRRQLEPVEYPSQDWWHEFVGLFFGEGSISLLATNKGSTTGIRLSMCQRADNCIMLEDLLHKLGGLLYYDPSPGTGPVQGHPRYTWWLTGEAKCWQVLQHLATSEIPSKKREEAILALEYLRWRATVPYHYGNQERQIALSYVQRLKDMRTFKEPG